DNLLIILNRKTGKPVPNAKLSFWTSQYNRKARKYITQESGGNGLSNENGIVADKKMSSYYQGTCLIVHLDDTLRLNNFYLSNYRSDVRQTDQTSTFFFTDRSIYRPGQTIYFK